MGCEGRNYGIDFLKALGLLLIILAHVSAPQWINEVRNFDVPMMVFISGFLSRGSVARSASCFSYEIKRLHRLLIPTYVFLVVYFAILSFFSNLPSFKLVLATFLLQNDSIGYVWIIRVYLMCAIIVPFISRIDFSKKGCWLIAVLVYVLYEALCEFQIGTSLRLVDSTLFYIIPYGLVLTFGLNYDRFSRRKKCCMAVIFTLAFVSSEICHMVYTGHFCFVQQYKYSPRHIYLIHAMMYISILMLVIKYFSEIGKNRLVVFISKSSLWIYLWHILVLYIVKTLLNSTVWPVKFVIVISISVMITYFQNRIVDKFDGKLPKVLLKVFRG